jgi:hypothetical protein
MTTRWVVDEVIWYRMYTTFSTDSGQRVGRGAMTLARMDD